MKAFLWVMALAALVGIAAAATPSVIIVGAGMSGISAAKTLCEAGIKNILILEATDHIGGRIRKQNFADMRVEAGANWVEGVNGKEPNPIWTMVEKLKLRNFFSDYKNLSSNTYSRITPNGPFEQVDALDKFNDMDKVIEGADNFSKKLPPSGDHDISILTYQRIANKVPSSPLDMAIEYYHFDYEFAEPPRLTSLQNTQPLSTFTNFGDDVHFVADQRGFEFVVYYLARQFLKADNKGRILDSRLRLNKVVTEIAYYDNNVIVKTEDGSSYNARYVMLSPSIGVLQSDLIKFVPNLPPWKIIAVDQFDMAIYTKIFIKFPYRFWPSGNGTNFFLYANERRGYYPFWQHFEVEYPGSNVLLVTVTDIESRRIEQQLDSETLEEVMDVLRDMFGKNIPNATDILVPKWWTNRFYKGSFSNWPIGVNKYDFDKIRAPVGRVYFTGEHTSMDYNGYVHGAYLADEPYSF